MKRYKVRFYAVSVEQPDGARRYRIGDLFRELAQAAQDSGGHCPPSSDGAVTYEIRDLKAFNHGAVFTGVFAVMRDDAPHIRGNDRAERPIELGEDEGVMEKNHFMFHSRQGLLVYQVNKWAAHPTRFSEYLTAMAGLDKAVVFGDILTSDAWHKLQDGIVKRVEVTIDAPRNPLQYDPGDFGRATLRQLDQAGASRVTVALSTSRGHEGMRGWVKEQLHRLTAAEVVRSMKVKMDGEEQMIDLLADTVKDDIVVLMHGHYPDTQQTFEELDAAHRRQRDALSAHFGE